MRKLLLTVAVLLACAAPASACHRPHLLAHARDRVRPAASCAAAAVVHRERHVVRERGVVAGVRACSAGGCP